MIHRIALLLAAVAVAAASLSVTPAITDEGWHGGDHEWRGHQWSEHGWRERAWHRHEGWEHRRWYPGYYNYGYYHYATSAHNAGPGVTFGFSFC